MSNNTLERIKELEDTLALLKKEITTKGVPWEPNGGPWTVSSKGAKEFTTKDIARAYGLGFSTEEAANKAFKAYRAYHRLYKVAEELNEGWEPDWSTRDSNYCIERDSTLTWCVTSYAMYNSPEGIYFKTYELAVKAIELLALNEGK